MDNHFHINPTKDDNGHQGKYPVLLDQLTNAVTLYDRCLNRNYHTSPILDVAHVFIVIGTVTYVSSGPLVILSRQAFYYYTTLGAILLVACLSLIRAGARFLHGCLTTTQSERIDNAGTLKEKLFNGTLFEAINQVSDAKSANVGWYLSFLGFIPLVVMGCIVGKVIGRPI